MKHRISEQEIAAQLPRIKVEAYAVGDEILGTIRLDGIVDFWNMFRAPNTNKEEAIAEAIEWQAELAAAKLAAPAGWKSLGQEHDRSWWWFD